MIVYTIRYEDGLIRHDSYNLGIFAKLDSAKAAAEAKRGRTLHWYEGEEKESYYAEAYEYDHDEDPSIKSFFVIKGVEVSP